VEPFSFTTNYTLVWAFDPESQSCKLFKVSRVGEVQVLDQNYKNEPLHTKQPIDVFRISSAEQTHVKLNLSIRAFNLLTEEYPLAEKYITSLGDNYCQFSAEVCGFEGVGRFVLGLAGEIQIIEPDEFRNYISEKIKMLDLK
jgi:predicted DNA-binding transcriptional regulator YafY